VTDVEHRYFSTSKHCGFTITRNCFSIGPIPTSDHNVCLSIKREFNIRSGETMGLQQYRFRFFTYAKYGVFGLLALGFIASFHRFSVLANARKIEVLSDTDFAEYILSVNYQSMSIEALDAIATKALSLTPPNVEIAQTATREIMKHTENCLDCEGRIVFMDLTKNQKLTQEGLVALSKTYELSPYGETEFMKWRLQVSSKFWNDLDEDLRKSALTQITALSQGREERKWLQSLPTEIDAIKKRLEVLDY
jgi:hypothetical protein